MKRIMTVCALFFVLVFGFNCNSFAENEIEIDVDMSKEVFSHGEYYGCEIEIGSDGDVDWVLVLVPNNELLCLRNTLGLKGFVFEAEGISYEEFASKFPEGVYTVLLLPQSAQSMSVHMNHNFPATPVITYPADGATNVPTDATITWELITGINGLLLSLNTEREEVEFEIDLPINSTSFTLSTGLLQSNTNYELTLEAEIDDGRGNELSTCRCIYFTTAGE